MKLPPEIEHLVRFDWTLIPIALICYITIACVFIKKKLKEIRGDVEPREPSIDDFPKLKGE